MKARLPRALSPRHRLWLGGGTLLLATLLGYWPALRASFVWDDTAMLTTNPFVKLPAGLFYIWASTALPDYYPLTYTSLWIEWRLWGLNATGYHLTNVLLHAASAVVLWRVIVRLGLPGGWIAALLFALHPVNVQSVAWIAERKNTLCMVFFLLSVWGYVRYAQGQSRVESRGSKAELASTVLDSRRSTLDYALALLFFALALLSKTAVVALPVFLLLFHWWQATGPRAATAPAGGTSATARQARPRPSSNHSFNQSPNPPFNHSTDHPFNQSTNHPFTQPAASRFALWPVLLRLAPFFALALALGLVTLWFQAHRAISGTVIREADFPTRLAAAGQAIWFYVGKLFWPRELCFVYAEWKTNAASPLAWLPLAGVLVVFGVGWRFRRGWGRHVILVWGWFVLFLLPVLGLVDIFFHRYALVADHWVYFAGLGLISGVVVTGAWLFQRHKNAAAAWLLPAGAAGAALAFGVSTWRQTAVYQDLGTLWADTLRKNPDCWLAHNSLGSALADAGQFRAAREHFDRALAIKPDAPEVLNNIASLLLDQGKPQEAMPFLRRALEVAPDSAMARYNLGNAYDQLGQTADAETAYRRAVELDPAHAEAWNNLGCLLYATGRKAEAADAFAQAASLRPDYADALNNLGVVFLEQGRFTQAESLLLDAVRHRPNYPDGWFNLGNALLAQGRVRDAANAYRRVLAFQPQHPLAHCRLGIALWHGRDTNAALADLETALQLQPNLAEAHHQLGSIRTERGEISAALPHLRRAVELNPDQPEALASLAFAMAARDATPETAAHDALALAERAVERTQRTNAHALDALAAALANLHRHAEAAQTAALAAQQARAQGDTNRAAQIELRRQRYESGQPWRP